MNEWMNDSRITFERKPCDEFRSTVAFTGHLRAHCRIEVPRWPRGIPGRVIHFQVSPYFSRNSTQSRTPLIPSSGRNTERELEKRRAQPPPRSRTKSDFKRRHEHLSKANYEFRTNIRSSRMNCFTSCNFWCHHPYPNPAKRRRVISTFLTFPFNFWKIKAPTGVGKRRSRHRIVSKSSI